MKVLHEDPRGHEVRLVPETLDDLWHLSELIEKGDRVKASTWRTKESKEDRLRGEKTPKVRVDLTIRVDEVEFAAFTDHLRVRGPIEAGSDELGAYHTITFEADGMHDLRLFKEGGFRPHHRERIREAVAAAKRPLVTIVCIDDEEAVVAVLRQYGIHTHATIRRRAAGKMFPSEDTKEEYFGETFGALRRARSADSPLVVVGPGFTRDSFVQFVRERDAKWLGAFVSEGTGQAGAVGVQEALKRGIVERIQQGQQVAADTMLVEEVFAEIAKNGPVAYGVHEVEALVDQGAARLLLMTDELLRTQRGESLLERARRTQAKAHVVATTHEAGKKLQGIGGVAALLRYRVDR